MNRKFVGIIIIILGVVLLAGVIYVIFLDGFSIYDFIGKFKKPPLTEKTEEKKIVPVKDTVQVSKEPKKIIINENTDQVSEEEEKTEQNSGQVGKYDLSRMAGSFAERFGSYSNQSNFSNIVDLKIFMSRRMKTWVDSFVTEQQKTVQSDIYYGIITQAVGDEVLDIDDHAGQASIMVKTRRREATGSINNVSRVFDQAIIISFIKESGAWKVDSANWQTK